MYGFNLIIKLSLADKISGDPAQVKLSKQQGRALGVA
jgi:hypothetical protein